jgi:hypothetical protein
LSDVRIGNGSANHITHPVFQAHVTLIKGEKIMVDQKIARIFLFIWLSLWIFLLFRNLHGPEGVQPRFRLAGLNFEDRRRQLYGLEFCRFMDFCRQNLPAGSTFLFVGPDDQSVTRPRAYLELYPHMPCDRPDFLLVYQAPGYSAPKTRLYAKYSPENYILMNLEKQ